MSLPNLSDLEGGDRRDPSVENDDELFLRAILDASTQRRLALIVVGVASTERWCGECAVSAPMYRMCVRVLLCMLLHRQGSLL